MKFLVSLIFLSFVTTLCHAQISKNTVFLGGSLNFSYDNNETETKNIDAFSKEKGFVFRIFPDAGIFLSDKVSIGLGVGYSYNRDKRENQYVNTTPDHFEQQYHGHSVSAKPFLRYHKFFGERVGIFGQLYCTVGWGKSQYEYDTQANFYTDTEQKTFTFSTGVSPGLIVFIKDNLGVETTIGTLGYRFISEKTTYDDEDINDYKRTWSNVNVDFHLSSIYFGIKYYL